VSDSTALATGSGLPVRLAGASDVLDRWLAGRKPTTRDAYGRDVEDFAGWLGVAPSAAVERLLAHGAPAANGLVLDYVNHLKALRRAHATINRRIAALQSLVKVARLLGMVAWTIEVQREKVKPYRDTRGPGRAGVRRLYARLREREDPKGARDVAIFRLDHDLGLRRGEIVSLDLSHLELGDESRVWVMGKGDDGRMPMTLPAETVAALRTWLAARGSEPGPLFLNFDRAGKGGRLTGRSVHRIVTKLGAQLGIRVTPHGVRHTAITTVLDESGGDYRAAQRFSRHVNSTTLRYYDDSREDLGGKMARLIAAGL
jgi:integrase/recombinase XerC